MAHIYLRHKKPRLKRTVPMPIPEPVVINPAFATAEPGAKPCFIRKLPAAPPAGSFLFYCLDCPKDGILYYYDFQDGFVSIQAVSLFYLFQNFKSVYLVSFQCCLLGLS